MNRYADGGLWSQLQLSVQKHDSHIGALCVWLEALGLV